MQEQIEACLTKLTLMHLNLNQTLLSLNLLSNADRNTCNSNKLQACNYLGCVFNDNHERCICDIILVTLQLCKGKSR